MKKCLVAVVLAATLLSGGLAIAEDTAVTLGLKVWGNSWEIEDKTDDTTMDLGTATMAGPSITVKSGSLFVGATFLTTTKDYSDTNTDIPGLEIELDMSRDDLDILAGYMFTPRVGVYIGYKSIKAVQAISVPAADINDQDAFDVELKGPGIGIMGNVPLNDVVVLYGNLAVLSLKSTSKPTDWWLANFDPLTPETSETLTGASVEAGAAFVFDESWSANVGIKSQSFSGDDEENKFSGLTLGLNYTF